MCDCGREWDEEYQDTVERVRACLDEVALMVDQNDCVLYPNDNYQPGDLCIMFMVWTVDLFMILTEVERLVEKHELQELFVNFASPIKHDDQEYISILLYFLGVPCCEG